MVLAVRPLDLERQDGFLDLAPEAPLGRQEEDLGQLLGDGGAALDDAACLDVSPQGPGDPPWVDASVIVKAGILSGDDGLNEGLGDASQGNEDALLKIEGGD